MTKKDDSQVQTQNTAKKAIGSGILRPTETSRYEMDNRFPGALNDPETEIAGVRAELLAYVQNPDTSIYSDIGHRQVMEKVGKAVEKGDFRTAVFELFREDEVKITHQVAQLILRLNRIDQIANRQFTTDVMEMSQAKETVKNNQERLLNLYAGNNLEKRKRAELALLNVQNSHSGTTEESIDNLEIVREMVELGLRQDIKAQFENPLPPHKLSGQEEEGVKNQNYLRSDFSANITENLRLFDALTIEIMKQKQNVIERDGNLAHEQGVLLTDLKLLEKSGNLEISPMVWEGLKNKASILKPIGRVRYFLLKVDRVKRALKQPDFDKSKLEQEIHSWLKQDFSPEQLQKEKTEHKKEDSNLTGQLLKAA